LRVLVAGAEGFVGRHIVVALEAARHEVIAGVRQPSAGHLNSITCDFSRDLDPDVWSARLAGIDVVINAIGILRESKSNSFACIHVAGPRALFQGCILAGVRRVIQISALGSPNVSEYLASKHRGDADLEKLDLDWTILRPSLVYSLSGSYGGTSLLRAMAALPAVICVPGSGEQLIQPIRAQDLALGIVCLIEKGAGSRQVIAAVGPERVTLLEYLQTLRRWLELPNAIVIRVPVTISHWVAWLGEVFSAGPLGITMWRMLREGNVAIPNADREFALLSEVPPLSLREAFALAPSFVQDRWHARLYFLGPILRLALAFVWLFSAVVGFATPLPQSQALFVSAGLPAAVVAPLVWVASTLDLILGILALIAWRPEVVAALMCASLVIYTAFIGLLLPSVWLDPFGGILKNLPLIPAVLVMGVLARHR
jgi:uncharacterized protein YbjT (DUF2867 family)